jgi:hypothetical protein
LAAYRNSVQKSLRLGKIRVAIPGELIENWRERASLDRADPPSTHTER